MLKLSWTEKMKNEEVLQQMKADQYLEGQETDIFWIFDTAK